MTRKPGVWLDASDHPVLGSIGFGICMGVVFGGVWGWAGELGLLGTAGLMVLTSVLCAAGMYRMVRASDRDK